MCLHSSPRDRLPQVGIIARGTLKEDLPWLTPSLDTPMHMFSVSPQKSPCPIVIDPPRAQRCCLDLGGGCQEADRGSSSPGG